MARVVGKVFAGLGLLARGHVVEAQRVDLVGQHLGETAIKTSKIIDEALDGVLFIDEAYALSNTGYSGGDAFGKEALQVLLKRAEDDRHRLVVILAGYPNEIAELLSTNPGLASRFNTRVDFPAYSADELVLIAESFLGAQGDAPTEEAALALRTSCDLAVTDGLIDRLGNGRFARANSLGRLPQCGTCVCSTCMAAPRSHLKTRSLRCTWATSWTRTKSSLKAFRRTGDDVMPAASTIRRMLAERPLQANATKQRSAWSGAGLERQVDDTTTSMI
ncbi:AAA family ATPase [Streptomyces sp. NPDC002125]